MKKIVAAVCLLAGAMQLQGRLGESVEEIGKRYGPVVETGEVEGLNSRSYRFKTFLVTVLFKNGRSVCEWLLCTNRIEALNDETCLALATSVSGVSGWERGDTSSLFLKQWNAQGHSALWSAAPLEGHSLMIAGPDFLRFVQSLKDGKLRALASDFGAAANVVESPRALAAEQALAAGYLAAVAAEKKKLEDDARLVKWLSVQATNGSASAQLDLGLRYRDGRGVPRDVAAARNWLEKSAAQGSVEAQVALKKLNNSAPASQ